VLGWLGEGLTGQQAGDIGLVISELVTNSVRHAGMDPAQTIHLDVSGADGRLRIVVTDTGSASLPEMAEHDPTVPGGLGLVLVDKLSVAWGVERDAGGTTRVWCELAL
jgi:anti-sigma regulatory factor (Ser/Thr protein kinase)